MLRPGWLLTDGSLCRQLTEVRTTCWLMRAVPHAGKNHRELRTSRDGSAERGGLNSARAGKLRRPCPSGVLHTVARAGLCSLTALEAALGRLLSVFIRHRILYRIAVCALRFLSNRSTDSPRLRDVGINGRLLATLSASLRLRSARPIPVGESATADKQRRDMRMRKMVLAVVPVLMAGLLAGCSDTNKSPDVADNIRKSLDQAGYKDVSVSQDRDKGVVTLTGTVLTEGDKAQAESIAKSGAGAQVVADQIAVRPPGNESDAKTVDSDMDKAIEKNLDAVLVKNKLKKDVKYDVKNGVVTLTGDVISQSRRAQVEKLANTVPNVKQVVNELEVKNQKASSTS